MRNGLALIITASLLLLTGCDNGATDATGGPVTMRRLTAEQYSKRYRGHLRFQRSR